MAAVICAVWFESSSMACLPSSTRSASCFLASSARILLTWSGCRVSISAAGTSTWTPLSAPMASAVLSVSCACAGPHVTTTTSLASFFSLSLTASSTAISSKGFMECLTPSVTTPLLSGLTRILTA